MCLECVTRFGEWFEPITECSREEHIPIPEATEMIIRYVERDGWRELEESGETVTEDDKAAVYAAIRRDGAVLSGLFGIYASPSHHHITGVKMAGTELLRRLAEGESPDLIAAVESIKEEARRTGPPAGVLEIAYAYVDEAAVLITDNLDRMRKMVASFPVVPDTAEEFDK